MKKIRKPNLLLIGHITDHVSGSSLLFRQLVEKLSDGEHVNLRLVNTVRPQKHTSNILVNLIVAFVVNVRIIRNIMWANVISFHSSRPAMITFGPVVWLISKIFKRPLMLRLMGGRFEYEYDGLSPVIKKILEMTLLSADLILLETKQLVSYFNSRAMGRVKWFSNYRELMDLSSNQKTTLRNCTRFVFLGRVVKEKGIDVIIDSAKDLDPRISVDIFGPIDGDYTAEQINAKGNGVVQYKGVISSQQVSDELFNYDALILPTFYPGEGYPGVILEAYLHGLPVVATRWRAIPEIVNRDTGILIPVYSADALSGAMNRLCTDMDLYARLRIGVLEQRHLYSEEYWTDRFVEWCACLSNKKYRRDTDNV